MKIITFAPMESNVIKLTKDEAINYGINIEEDCIRGDLKTVDFWSIPVTFKALAISVVYGKTGYNMSYIQSITIYGKRSMFNIRQSGYCIDGISSILGKKRRCFTSSQLFEVDGKIISVEVIHARKINNL